MKSLISRWEYVVIALGILMIPIGIALIVLACVAWRIGTKMEKRAQQQEVQSIGQDIGEEEITGTDIKVDETYKCNEYSEEVLVDGK